MHQRLQISLAQVKADIASKNLLKDIRHMLYSLIEEFGR